MHSVFGELSPASGRVVGEGGRGPFGWCCFPSSLLLGGAAWPPPSLGQDTFTPARSGLVLHFLEPVPPKRGGGRQHDQKEEEAKPPHPKASRGKPPPLKGRRRDHHSTELKSTSVDLTNLFVFSKCIDFFLKEKKRHHPTGKRRKIAPTLRRRRMGASAKRKVNFSLPSLFWTVVPFPHRCDPFLLLVVLPSTASFGVCFLPLPSWGGAAVPL